MTAAAPWALVTGGSRGIGGAITMELASAGWNVAVVYLRDSASATATADAVRLLGRQCTVIEANIGKADECTDVVRQVTASGVRLSGLVHAAGLGALSAALDTRPARWQLAWDTHVGALLSLASAARPHFARDAAIVGLTSLGAVSVMPGYASIAAAKGALESTIRYLAAELAPIGVRVNAVRGGPVDTASLRSFDTFQAVEAESHRRIPGRLGMPADIAPVVAFLLGRHARWITGQIITADGGFSLH